MTDRKKGGGREGQWTRSSSTAKERNQPDHGLTFDTQLPAGGRNTFPFMP